MNTSRLSERRQRSGVAIILVLSILVLLTVVVVAFFTNATTDLTASKSYSDEIRVKLLGDSAVNIVQSAIKSATQGGVPGRPEAWASQPGMIRTYGTDGRAIKDYKLYSSDALQVTPDELSFADDVPMNWNSMPGDFVDLNSPSVISDPAGSIKDPKNNTLRYSARFPIVDGNNLKSLPWGKTAEQRLQYDMNPPESDGSPKGNDVPDIEGFAVKTPGTYDPNKLIAPNNNPVPMPVRWLYMLQDGQLQPRNAQSGVISGASKSNPVVSRIAFWTDDDTCKLNINTASEGTSWTRPWAKTYSGDASNVNTEEAISKNMPAQNEFQMFPGHPSRNSLSTVFGSLWPVKTWLRGNPASNYQQMSPYYDLSPRVTEGKTNGSAGGTQPTQNASATGVTYDADPLYASVDELMFNTKIDPSNNSRKTRNDVNNVPGDGKQLAITPQFLETTRFFLTTSNRAPEVTLLNTPRIGLWPLQGQASTGQTAKEKLLAFCSTIPANSSRLYAFQRYNELKRPAETLTRGTSLSSDSPKMDFELIPRNQAIYKYLQNMVQADVPGLGGNFSKKYGSRTDQILTEMADQIRSSPNLYQFSESPQYVYTQAGQVIPIENPLQTAGTAVTRGFGRFMTVTEASLDLFRCGDTTKKEYGNSVQLGGVLMLGYFNPAPGYASLRQVVEVEIEGLDKFTIERSGVVGSRRSLGLPGKSSNYVDQEGGFSGNCTAFNGLFQQFFQLNGSPKLPLKGLFGPGDGNFPFFSTPDAPPATAAGTLGVGNLPIDPLDPNGGTFDLNGGGPQNITINLWTLRNPKSPATPRVKIQTLTMTFLPSRNLPIPQTREAADYSPASPSHINGMAGAGPLGSPSAILYGRLNTVDQNLGIFKQMGSSDPVNGRIVPLIDQKDVVRSIVVDPKGPSKGDFRVICALKEVQSNYFAPHPFYDYAGAAPADPALDPNPGAHAFNWRFAHSLRFGDNPGWGTLGWYQYAGSPSPSFLAPSGVLGWPTRTRKSVYAGPLVADLPVPAARPAPTYYPEAFPAVPIGTPGAIMTNGSPGDWDNGNGALEDGPYISKADEGNSQPANTDGYSQSTHATSIYYSRYGAAVESGRSYSPNRAVSSAVLFGSLPTGIDPDGTASMRPWQTLLFCANPAAGLNHPGFGISSAGTTAGLPASGVPAPPYRSDGVPDHYILDLFTMPIVEPYAISEPLSSQGKVNMNYQLAPFTYIQRDTAVRAVMKSTRMMAIPSTESAANGKTSYKSAAGSTAVYRYSIDSDETLSAFEDRFTKNDIFRSASEICSVPLVPKVSVPTEVQPYDPKMPSKVTSDPGSLTAFWALNKLTGDNVREEPYGDLYAR